MSAYFYEFGNETVHVLRAKCKRASGGSGIALAYKSEFKSHIKVFESICNTVLWFELIIYMCQVICSESVTFRLRIHHMAP